MDCQEKIAFFKKKFAKRGFFFYNVFMEIEQINRYVGSKIKEYRKYFGLSQEELAKKIGVGKTTISNYEVGLRSPKKPQMIKLSEVFGISIDDFFPTVESSKINVSPILSEINRISSVLDEERQQVVLNTAHEQHDEQEAERKAKEPIPLYMDDEAIYGHIDRAAAWQGEEITDEDRDAIMIALKKHLEEKAKEESNKGK